MGACASYFAVIKGYCTMSMFTLPIGFKYGGWLFSPLVLFMAFFVETFSAVRLCQAAREAEIYNYPDLVEYVLGKTARYIIQWFVAGLHFVFTLSALAVFARTPMSILKNGFDIETSIWIWAGVTLVIFAPIAWVRNVEVFSVGYLYGVLAILLMIIVISTFCIILIQENGGEAGRDWVAFNEEEYITMIGIAFF